VLYIDHDAAFGTRVALAEIVRHVRDKSKFVLDLFPRVSRRRWRQAHGHGNIQ
jgi:hypothetical protein